jgi:hypothetical protein
MDSHLRVVLVSPDIDLHGQPFAFVWRTVSPPFEIHGEVTIDDANSGPSGKMANNASAGSDQGAVLAAFGCGA